jgi:hypothetical protein
VLPIPPGTHWQDARPIVLPGGQLPVAAGQLPVKKQVKSKRLPATGNPKPATISAGGLRFAVPTEALPQPRPKSKRQSRRAGMKNDPRLVAAARELRDRWLERVAHEPQLLESRGKYRVCRSLEASGAGADSQITEMRQMLPPLLAA